MGTHIEILTDDWSGKTVMLMATKLMILSIFCSSDANYYFLVLIFYCLSVLSLPSGSRLWAEGTYFAETHGYRQESIRRSLHLH